MKLAKSKLANENYISRVIKIDNFTKHPNPEVTRMKVAHVGGYSVIVGIDEQPGLFVYFQVNSQLNPDLLSYLNLYEKPEMNRDTTQKGLFNVKGRVKAIKLKGFESYGFLLPYNKLQEWILNSVNVQLPEEENGTEFDSVEHNGKEFWISKKYIVQTNISIQRGNNNKKNKRVKLFDRVIPEQFHFHYETILLRKDPHIINPDDIIHISSKWHGTSAISAYVMTKTPLSWYEKLYNWFVPRDRRITGVKYDYLIASRKVVINNDTTIRPGYYGNNEFRVKADSILRPFMTKGMTIYYEIVGFTDNGSYIQKNYDYGCVPPKQDESYTVGKHYKIYVYRITLTNVDGCIYELSTQEVQRIVKSWNVDGVLPVIQLYYGKADSLYKKDENLGDDWSSWFMEKMANDKNFFMEELSPDCINKVPHEGIVIKKETGRSEAWKLKCFKFLNKEQKELDKGESNIEDNA